MTKRSTKRYDEATLLAALQSNHQQAFTELHERFAPNLMRVIKRLVTDHQQAQDLLQDSFIRIWRHLPRFNADKGRLYTWMRTITQNVALRFLHASRYTRNQLNDMPLDEFWAVTPSYQTIGLDAWIASTLKANEQKTVKLMYFQDYTFQEIADELGMPLGSVKTNIRRGLQKLRLSDRPKISTVATQAKFINRPTPESLLTLPKGLPARSCETQPVPELPVKPHPTPPDGPWQTTVSGALAKRFGQVTTSTSVITRLIDLYQNQIDSTVLQISRMGALLERANQTITTADQKTNLLNRYQSLRDGYLAYLARVEYLQQKELIRLIPTNRSGLNGCQ